MTFERPQCVNCKKFRLRKDLSGFEAYCAAKTKHGRMIDWQYGLDMEWCKNELMDKIRSRICPGWCIKWKEIQKYEQSNRSE